MANEWDLIWRLALAFLLSGLIGLEREMRQKSAGLRTYTVVGLGSALFMLISKYGFFDLLDDPGVSLDPSRVAAQIVSGIGFIGAGLIFVRRDAVHGLTTAAGVWLTAAVGAACGASLPILAVATTIAYFMVILGLAPLAARLPSSRYAPAALHLVYRDEKGILRRVLAVCTARGFTVSNVKVDHNGGEGETVSVSLEIRGRGSMPELVAELQRLEGIKGVVVGDVNEIFD